MILKVLLGTKNPDKCRELRRLLRRVGVRVQSLRDFPHCPDVVEDGRTFEANAKKKARVYARHTGVMTLADDSGLKVCALRGKPGVYSARFAGPRCSYDDNNRKLLRLLRGVPRQKRGATFVCVAVLYKGRRLVGCVRGECHGRIAFEAQGQNGFGYDPVFIPAGYKKTFAELSPGLKNRLSHRGRALRKAVRVISGLMKS